MNPSEGPEPGNWELYRLLQKLERSVDSLGSKVVSMELYVRDRTAQEEENKELHLKISNLEGKVEVSEKARAASDSEREKDRRAKNWQWLFLIAGLGVTTFLNWVLNGGLVR